MIDLRITIERISPNVRTFIRWDNPIAIADGYCADARRVDGELVGQFSMCPIYVTDSNNVWAGTWAENQIATRLTPLELQKIAALQEADNFTVDQKMNWLTASAVPNGWGSPINTRGEDWEVATDIKMIASCYAGQPVTLTGETMERVITLNGRTNKETLHRIKTYSPAEWSRANCQIVTAVSKDNVYTEQTRGKIILPVYFKNRRAWALGRWLV